MHRPKFHIVLYQPQIPQNTGSIARLCACTGASLHLIRPLGFRTDEHSVKRAGLDYWEHVDIVEHENWEGFLEKEKPEKLVFLSKFGKKNYFEMNLKAPCYFVFGNETKGLPPEIHDRYASSLFQIPMRTHLVRSLNLSQAASIVLYEGLRQEGFEELTGHGFVEYPQENT